MNSGNLRKGRMHFQKEKIKMKFPKSMKYVFADEYLNEIIYNKNKTKEK